jgi:predicted N-acetyltransferase YhbS
MSLEIRPLQSEEFTAADAVIRAAFGRDVSFVPMLRLTLEIEPEGVWCAQQDGRVVGTVSVVDYGEIAYIGLTTVAPDWQRRGIARQLIVRMLERLAERGERTVLLDATDEGAPLYASLGFVDDHTAYHFEHVSSPNATALAQTVRLAETADLPAITTFDRPAFGADRSRLFAALWREHAGRCLVSRDAHGRLNGYLFARDPVLGPWAAIDSPTAEALLSAAQRFEYQYSPQVLVPRSNMLAVELLARSGFERRRTLRHMRFGGSRPPGLPRQLYGQSSFGHG